MKKFVNDIDYILLIKSQLRINYIKDNLKEIKIKASKRAVFSSFSNITSYLNNCHSHEAFCEGINNILDAYRMFHFDVLFSGDDHSDDADWNKDKKLLEQQGADIVFFAYTQKVSSTKLRANLQEKI